MCNTLACHPYNFFPAAITARLPCVLRISKEEQSAFVQMLTTAWWDEVDGLFCSTMPSSAFVWTPSKSFDGLTDATDPPPPQTSNQGIHCFSLRPALQCVVNKYFELISKRITQKNPGKSPKSGEHQTWLATTMETNIRFVLYRGQEQLINRIGTLVDQWVVNHYSRRARKDSLQWSPASQAVNHRKSFIVRAYLVVEDLGELTHPLAALATDIQLISHPQSSRPRLGLKHCLDLKLYHCQETAICGRHRNLSSTGMTPSHH